MSEGKEPKRRAPKEGYTSQEKQEYRESLWDKKLRTMTRRGISLFYSCPEFEQSKILILPSQEGLEVKHLVEEQRISEERIVCVEENPAVIANSRWRKEFPNVNFLSGRISEVGHKIKQKGWVISAANLDFCYNFSEDLVSEIDSFLRKTPLDVHSFISVTIMKGREGRVVSRLLKRLNNDSFSDCRLAALKDLLNYRNQEDPPVIDMPFHEGSYKSNAFQVAYGTFMMVNNRVPLHRVKEKEPFMTALLGNIKERVENKIGKGVDFLEVEGRVQDMIRSSKIDSPKKIEDCILTAIGEDPNLKALQVLRKANL